MVLSAVGRSRRLAMLHTLSISFLVIRPQRSPRDSARIILDGTEMVLMMRKRQARFAFNTQLSLADQFRILAV